MYKKKKNFWKEMYLSNGWFVEHVATPIIVAAFFITVGYFTNKIPYMSQLFKTDSGMNIGQILVWNLICGFFATGIIIILCIFVYEIPYSAVSKTLAVARYCKLPLSREELIAAKNSNIFTDANSYFTYIRKKLEYCQGKRSLSLTDDEIEEAIRISIEAFDLKQDDIIHVNDNFHVRIMLKNTETCDIECSDQFHKGEIIRRYFWAVRPDGTLYDPLK